MEPERKDGKKAREEHAGQTPASLPESNESAEEFADDHDSEKPGPAGRDREGEREADLKPGSDRERGRARDG